MPEIRTEQDPGVIFALDIGTRSIIGMLGRAEEGRFHVSAIEKEEHGRRAMLDGQIVEIEQVAQVARRVISRLEDKAQIKLRRVCVAAAGRALKSQSAQFTLEFDGLRQAGEDLIGQLEAGAVSEAERQLAGENAGQGRFYMVGYTARQYVVDGYPMTNLLDHRGKVFQADVVATFLPSGVVESLYAVTARLGLEVSSLTLEPIAALNAAIPEGIRLLNLVLVDVGAGTSDIAVCREGSVVGYTMATVAGDEITELLMRSLLVDFPTAERLKMSLGSVEPISYLDILGMKHEISSDSLAELLQPAAQKLAKEIAEQILELNGGQPSAVFLAGGGSKLQGLAQLVAGALDMSEARVALAGNHFEQSAFSEEFALNDPEFATPLGIGASAALGMINDSYMVTLNGYPAKLFRNGSLCLRDVLLMNGFHYGDMMGRTGSNLSYTLNGRREFLRGMPGTDARMQVNGQEAELTAVIQAGDRIDFTPARPGTPAQQTLAQRLGRDFPGTVTVNGEAQALEYAIRQGDQVEAVGGPVPEKPLPNARPAPEPPRPSRGAPGVPHTRPDGAPAAPVRLEAASAAAGGKSAPQPSLPSGGAEAPASAKAAEPAPEPAAKTAAPVTESKEPEAVLEKPSKPAASAEGTKEPVERKPLRRVLESRMGEQLSFGGLRVVLNGAPLRLPPKEEGGKYLLMDLLEYSGLDFENLDRPVELKVNGVEGQFSQVLRPNDQVTIQLRND